MEFQRVIKDATRRVVHDTVPMKTEYFLTEPGESPVPIIRLMDAWGNEHRGMFDEIGNVRWTR